MFSRFMPSWSTTSLCVAVLLIASVTVAFNATARTRLNAGVLAESRGGNQGNILDRLRLHRYSLGTSPCTQTGSDCAVCTQGTYHGHGIWFRRYVPQPTRKVAGDLKAGEMHF